MAIYEYDAVSVHHLPYLPTLIQRSKHCSCPTLSQRAYQVHNLPNTYEHGNSHIQVNLINSGGIRNSGRPMSFFLCLVVSRSYVCYHLHEHLICPSREIPLRERYNPDLQSRCSHQRGPPRHQETFDSMRQKRPNRYAW